MRRLTNVEWSLFLDEVDVAGLRLPPWGGVVEWEGMQVLVYVPPGSQEVFLSDITGHEEIITNQPKTYDERSELWWTHLPEELMDVTAERAIEAGAMVAAAPAAIARAAKDVAEVGVNWILPLAVVGLLALVILKK